MRSPVGHDGGRYRHHRLAIALTSTALGTLSRGGRRHRDDDRQAVLIHGAVGELALYRGHRSLSSAHAAPGPQRSFFSLFAVASVVAVCIRRVSSSNPRSGRTILHRAPDLAKTLMRVVMLISVTVALSAVMELDMVARRVRPASSCARWRHPAATWSSTRVHRHSSRCSLSPQALSISASAKSRATRSCSSPSSKRRVIARRTHHPSRALTDRSGRSVGRMRRIGLYGATGLPMSSPSGLGIDRRCHAAWLASLLVIARRDASSAFRARLPAGARWWKRANLR